MFDLKPVWDIGLRLVWGRLESLWDATCYCSLRRFGGLPLLGTGVRQSLAPGLTWGTGCGCVKPMPGTRPRLWGTPICAGVPIPAVMAVPAVSAARATESLR